MDVNYFALTSCNSLNLLDEQLKINKPIFQNNHITVLRVFLSIKNLDLTVFVAVLCKILYQKCLTIIVLTLKIGPKPGKCRIWLSDALKLICVGSWSFECG